MTLNIVDILTRVEVPRDGRGKPLVVPPSGGRPKALVRTTTYVDALEDKSALADWKARGVMIASAKFPDVAREALKLDPEEPKDKQELNKLAERLFNMGGFNDKREKGTELHALSELVDQGIPLPQLPVADQLDMAAYMMGTVALTMHKIEQFVVIEEAGAAGTLDRLAEYEGPGPLGEPIAGNFITDLKTGRIDYGGLKIAAQLAAYSRGKVYDFTRFPAPDRDTDSNGFEKWKKTEFSADEAAAAYSPLSPAVNQDWGIIINLRPGSGEATLHWADLRVGWRAVEMAGLVREMRSLSKKALTAFA